PRAPLLPGHAGRGTGQDPRGHRAAREVPLHESHQRAERGHGQGAAAGAQEVVLARVDAVRERIAPAAARAGRSPDELTLVAVSKTHPPEAVREVFAAGVRHFGENKVQEAEGKIEALAELRAAGLRWHMVGHLQSNKARRAAELFDAVDSVD